MALAGSSLMALALLIGADPGPAAGGASAAPNPNANSFAAPAESPQLPGRAGGWTVSEVPAAAPAPEFPSNLDSPAAPVEIAAEPPTSNSPSLKLAPPREPRSHENGEPTPPSPGGAIASVVSSLAVVVGLFFLVSWLAKRSSPKGAIILPAEVLEVLGRTPLAPRRQLHVVRFGNKLVLLSITPSGVEPLAEIEDPVEVERLAGICQEIRTGSISETFRQVFSQFANEPAPSTFAGANRD